MAGMFTRFGVEWEPGALKAEQVSMHDIGHHLGLICRYGGAVAAHYSVAEHCTLGVEVMASFGHIRPDQQMSFLLHDAHEAYMGDLAAPIKRKCPSYRKLELQAMHVVLDLLCPWWREHEKLVDFWDETMYLAELKAGLPHRLAMDESVREYNVQSKYINRASKWIRFDTAPVATARFLTLYERLSHKLKEKHDADQS